MSTFWQRLAPQQAPQQRLAPQQAPQPVYQQPPPGYLQQPPQGYPQQAPQPYQPQPTLPWWAPQQAPQGYPQQPQGYPPQQYQQPYPGQQQPQQYPPPQDEGGWGTIEGSTRKAKSARLTETCPECGSSNYFRPTVATMPQCYECGYSTRFHQTAGGGGLPSGEGGPATPARQVAEGGGAGGISNYQPKNVIGRVAG